MLTFLFAATVVSPFNETAPVPVPNVPLPVWVRLLLFCTVTVPFEVSPLVEVMSPDMVGVAVQVVPVTVRLPPREVRFVPDTVKVLSRVVAPWRVSADPWRVNTPGVVPEPMVLVDEAPAPTVLTLEAPVPIVELPVEVIVVNAPDPWLVTPIVVKLPAAAGVFPVVPGAAHVAPNN